MNKPWKILSFGCVFLIFLAINSFFWKQKSLETNIKQKSIEKELSTLTAPLTAAQVLFDTHHKLGNPTASENFSQKNSSYSEVSKYYDVEFKRNGWNFISDKKSYDWGRDLGGRIRTYCKGDLSASLFYAGASNSYGWDFSIGISLKNKFNCN